VPLFYWPTLLIFRVFCFCVDSVADVAVDSNHVNVADVHAYVDSSDLASPDSDRLHLPVVADASRTAGSYIRDVKQFLSD